MSKQIKIYADMVADIFHRGHIEFLKKISKLYKNSYIAIGVLSDETVAQYKRKPIFCTEDRIEIIRNCRFVDEIIYDAPLFITNEFLKLHKIDIVAHGDDMTNFFKKYNYPIPIKLGIMRTVPRWGKTSTTKIIEKIKKL